MKANDLQRLRQIMAGKALREPRPQPSTLHPKQPGVFMQGLQVLHCLLFL